MAAPATISLTVTPAAVTEKVTPPEQRVKLQEDLPLVKNQTVLIATASNSSTVSHFGFTAAAEPFSGATTAHESYSMAASHVSAVSATFAGHAVMRVKTQKETTTPERSPVLFSSHATSPTSHVLHVALQTAKDVD